MKIAVLEPYIRGIGGAQKVIGEYCSYLLKQGHQVEVFTQFYDSMSSYSNFKNIKINILKPTSKLLSPLAFYKKFKGFDFLIANDWPSHFASLKNDNVVWICYNPKRDFYDLKDFYLEKASFKEKIILRLKQLLFKRCDKVAAKKCFKLMPISKTIQKKVTKYYDLSSKDIFYCGINFNDYSSGKQGDYFLSVARFVKPKRIEKIIEAMDFLKDKRIKLYLVGDGPEKGSILKMCKKNPNIVFLGSVSEKVLSKLYSNCLSLVYVPLDEDWGLIPLEAAASEKPIIASDEGGLKETIINNKTGLLIKNISAKNIAEKMNYLIEHKSSAKKLGKNAKKHLKNFDWKYLLFNFQEYLKILKK